MRSSLLRMRSSLLRMRSSLLRMRSSLLRMRSSLVVRASDCQCTSCNCPGFDPSIRRHSGIWGAADEAVLNIVPKKLKNPPNILTRITPSIIASDSGRGTDDMTGGKVSNVRRECRRKKRAFYRRLEIDHEEWDNEELIWKVRRFSTARQMLQIV